MHVRSLQFFIGAALLTPTVAAAKNVSGHVTVDLRLDIQAVRELAIREPSMCEGSASVDVKWNKAANRVEVKGDIVGLPYRPDLCYEYDPSTAYNDYPLCVEDGVWTMWVIGEAMTRTSVYYYDADTGDLIGNEFDLVGVPDNSIAVVLPAAQMICITPFESHPVTLKAKPKYVMEYDHILDGEGSPGAVISVLPVNLFETEPTLEIYYTDYHEAGPLPQSEAMNWDRVLENIESGLGGGPGGLGLVLSYEPRVKPDYLRGRDNVMIGWGGGYPQTIMPNPDPPTDCGTYQLDGSDLLQN